MSRSAPIAAPAPQPDPSADASAAVDEADLLAASVARVEHRLRLLDELAEMAMKMARRVTEEAAKAADAAASTYAADDLAKLSRALRLTLDLAGRLEESLRALRAGEATVRAAHRQIRAANDNRAAIERSEAGEVRVREQVAMAIAREAESESESCEFLDALEERLADDITYVFVGDTPLRETVERLCKDLGLSPDWSGWTEDGWPVTPSDSFPPREPWSPFSRPSRRPVLT